MLPVYVKYLSLLVWPMDLSAFYDTTIYHTFFAFPVVLSALFWVAIIISVFIWGNRQQKFWFSWAVLCFLPVSNILPIQVYYADRFLYLPQIGFFAFLAFTTISVTMLFKKRFNIAGDPTRVYSILAFAILSALAVTTTKRANVWENEITLWEDTVEKSPGLDGPHVNLGSAYERVGRYDGAIVQYEEAMKIYSNGEAARKLRALKARLMSGKNAD